MARRISRPASVQEKLKPNSSKSSKKRAKRSGLRTLNAFAIASAEHPDDVKIRPNRLGQREESPGNRKRRRQTGSDQDSEGEEESETEVQARKRRAKEKPAGEDDVSEGSDSEGNTWRLGHVDEDDDSEIDSDEAFGPEDGDEWELRGTIKNGKSPGKRNGKKLLEEDMNLDEDKPVSDSDESLGEEAVDLAQMLDDYEESDDAAEDAKARQQDVSEDSSEEDEDSHFSGFSEDEDEDEDETQIKNSKLQNLISSLHPKQDARSKTIQLYESTAPTAAGPTSKEKFDINSLLNSTSDPNLASLIKKVGKVPKELKNDPKLEPSLPKRHKDRLDRIAANKLAEKQLDRWVDSVKHMRRAEHLTFPLQNPDDLSLQASEHVLPVITMAPLNSLESTINNILQESGLAPNDDENDGFDEFPENKISLKEVLERRAELRRARELMFQEERRAKRIKKIKSKTYRRIHRKERERRMAAMIDEYDSDMDEMDREAHDRRRAEERMGAKHKDNKWAKQVKKAGRTIWDDDTRSGIAQMATRNEELRKRISGKDVRDNGDISSSNDDESDYEQFKLGRLNGKLNDLLVEDQTETGLSSLKFMRKAEQARKAENDAAVRRLKKELTGEDSSEPESEDENLGRRLFGPQAGKTDKATTEIRNEFEEPDSDDQVDNAQFVIDPSYRPSLDKTQPLAKSIEKSQPNSKAKSQPTSISKPLDPDLLPGETHSAPDTDGWVTVSYEKTSSNLEGDDDDQSELSQSEILRRAFAGDDFEEQFEREKAGVAEKEDEQVIDNTLEGWGSWVGDGVSKRERKRTQAIKAKNKFVTKKEGVRPQDRKDSKLKSVIISQKRVKSNAAFLASTLPFPFKTRAEYERSIRMPVGGEWNVAKSVQENTKPRVIVKPGRVVEPMAAPIV